MLACLFIAGASDDMLGYSKILTSKSPRNHCSAQNHKRRDSSSSYGYIYWFYLLELQDRIKNKGVPATRPLVWMAAYLKNGTPDSNAVVEVIVHSTNKIHYLK